jgi:hypothetical protein
MNNNNNTCFGFWSRDMKTEPTKRSETLSANLIHTSRENPKTKKILVMHLFTWRLQQPIGQLHSQKKIPRNNINKPKQGQNGQK